MSDETVHRKDLPTMKQLWFPAALGFFNCLPSTILTFLFYVLPKIITKQLRFARFKEKDEGVKILSYCIPMEVVEGSKLEKSAFWSAMSMGAFVTAARINRQVERRSFAQTIMHEQGHTHQQYIFGTTPAVVWLILVLCGLVPWWPLIPMVIFMQPVLYILCTCFIWVFLKNKHAYYDNVFEIWARAFADDKNTYVTKEMWQGWNVARGHDKEDRFIWW